MKKSIQILKRFRIALCLSGMTGWCVFKRFPIALRLSGMTGVGIIGTCLFATNVWALEARLVPNLIMQGESTELVISSDKPLSAPENLKELTQNFMIAGQQQRQSSQFVNGVGSTTYELAFVLFPLRQGEVAVPALKVGSEKTAPLTLKVVDKQQAGESAKDLPILELSADVSDHKPYVGQTIFYTLTLTDGQGVVDGEMIPTKIENARLSQIGQDKVASVIKNGQRVQEISRTYALTPDQAGKMEIDPALFNGQVRYQAQRPSSQHKFFGFADAGLLFDGFLNTTRPVSFTSNPVTIEVQPKPANVSGWWLPSTKVELSADYQVPQIVQVGDTISGKFILTAQEVNANDMPVPRLADSADFRIYPQPEERTTTIQDGHLMGRVSVPFMLIPLKAGKIEIPEVSVNWFNTITKKAKKTSVPARPIMVEQGSVAPVIGPKENQVIPAPVAEKAPTPETTQPAWIWVLVGGMVGLGLGALIVLLWYLVQKHLKKKKEKPLPDFYPFK